jgi:type II secretion system protein J
MRSRPAPAVSSGFTLIEMVISSALMSIVLVSAYLCLRAALDGRQLVQNRADAAQGARVALNLLSADLRSATPLSKEFDFLGIDRTLGAIEADNLDFATRNYTPRRANEGDFCEVSYFVSQDPKNGQYTLWRRRDPSPDAEPLSGGSRESIAEGVLGIRFEYYDGFEWYDEWGDQEGRRQQQQQESWLAPGNLSGLPEAVRVTLWFATDPKPIGRRPSDEEMDGDPETLASGPQGSTMAFQTVVRLNLAGLTWKSSGTTGSSAGSGTSQGAQQTQ